MLLGLRGYNAETDKQTWGWITLGLYAYQILDAIVFFPSLPSLDVGGAQLGVMDPASGNLGLRVNYEF